MVVFAHSFTYSFTFIFLAAFSAFATLVPLPELWSFHFLSEESFSFCTDPGSWGRDEKCE